MKLRSFHVALSSFFVDGWWEKKIVCSYWLLVHGFFFPFIWLYLPTALTSFILHLICWKWPSWAWWGRLKRKKTLLLLKQWKLKLKNEDELALFVREPLEGSGSWRAQHSRAGRNNMEAEVTPCVCLSNSGIQVSKEGLQLLPQRVRWGGNRQFRLPSEPEISKLMCADGREAFSMGGGNRTRPSSSASGIWKSFQFWGNYKMWGRLGFGAFLFPLSRTPSPFSSWLTYVRVRPYCVGTGPYLNQEVLSPMGLPHPSAPQGILKDWTGFQGPDSPGITTGQRGVIGKEVFIQVPLESLQVSCHLSVPQLEPLTGLHMSLEGFLPFFKALLVTSASIWDISIWSHPVDPITHPTMAEVVNSKG